MHKYKYTIDPITRLEGHLGIEVLVDDGEVKEAKCSGTLFRGFEIILKGRDPRDANRLTQRVCGVCPASHAKASAMCLDQAFGINKLTDNGRIIRNLILGCNFLQSDILHFYHLAALDYVDTKAAVGHIHPFTPRYEGDYRLSKEANQQAVSNYVKALDIRRKSHELLAIFGGKMPHNVGIIPGGATEQVTEDKITNFLWRLNEIREFIDQAYLADVAAELKGKLNGIAMRVPTFDASIVDLTVELSKGASVEEINAAMKKAATGEMQGILGYTEEPLVSVDIIGNPLSSIFDAALTMQIDKKFVKVASWYDNEWGFSCRMNDLAKLMGSKL